MLSFAIPTRAALLIIRGDHVEQHLTDQAPEAIAVDPQEPARLYAGTWGHGLWVSTDGGRGWEPAGDGIPHSKVFAVAVERTGVSQPSVVYAGTEPSTISRSRDGGANWEELPMLLDLPSSSSWSFPPKPHTHHVRWIETDPHVAGKLYVAIEAGALVRSLDEGSTWIDRENDGPIDTHTAASHPEAAGWIFSSAGDGYFESHDGGESWARIMDGLRHRYMVGVAVDPGDPETVVVSGASGPYASYDPRNAEAYVYRKSAGGPFELAMQGLPGGTGTVASRLATHQSEPNVFYAVNNHGLFQSSDAGRSWEAMDLEWPGGCFKSGVQALVAFSE